MLCIAYTYAAYQLFLIEDPILNNFKLYIGLDNLYDITTGLIPFQSIYNNFKTDKSNNYIYRVLDKISDAELRLSNLIAVIKGFSWPRRIG